MTCECEYAAYVVCGRHMDTEGLIALCRAIFNPRQRIVLQATDKAAKRREAKRREYARKHPNVRPYGPRPRD